MVALVILAILTLAGVVVTAGVRKARRQQAAQEQVLKRHGFKPCEGGVTHLEAGVRSLRGSSRFELRRPWERITEDAAVYWYEVGADDADSKQRIAADEFLFTLRRPSEQPFLLYLSPTKLGKGLGARVIEKLLVVTAPPGLQKLAPPASAHATNVLAAFGPPDASWSDLVDADQLALFAGAARYGVFAIRCRGEHCALEMFSAYARKAMEPVTWDQTWSFVRRVAASSTAASAGSPPPRTSADKGAAIATTAGARNA